MSAKADELRALADRCEREKPSAELDAAIASVADIKWSSDEEGNYGPYGIMPGRVRFTRSLDAAVTLVPMEWHFSVDRYNSHATAEVTMATGRFLVREDIERHGKAKTPALALCAAALRALAHQAAEERT